MCSPEAAALTVGGLTMVSEGYSIFQQNKNVSDLAEAQYESAEEAYATNIGRVTESTRQQEERLTAEQRERDRLQRHEEAKALAAFGDKGVTGVTPDKLISNIVMSGALDKAGIESTRENLLISDATQKRDAVRGFQSSANQVKSFITSNYVSPVEAGLRILTSGAAGGAQGAQLGGAISKASPPKTQ